jgi:ribonuclease G
MRTELLASRLGTLPFAALREGGELAELFIDGAPPGQRLGQILRARVSRVMPELDAAFVDLGGRRGGLLHAEDLLLPEESSGSKRPIAERVSPGRELIVQISREPLPGKGARLSCRLSFAGRFLVLLAADEGCRISRRITDPARRETLAAMLERLPPGCGWLARTAAAQADEETLNAEADSLRRRWRQIVEDGSEGETPRPIGSVEAPLARALRELDHGPLERVLVDSDEDLREARSALDGVGSANPPRVELHTDMTPLFAATGLDRELERLVRSRVWLPSGGRITVEDTEAMVSVDVDSGKFRGRGGREESALAVDLEAATAVARQLRVRGLGGIVAIDFIDLERAEHRDELLETLLGALARDRARSRVFGFHEPGLVLLTRERQRVGALAALTRPCRDCDGRGRAKTPPLVAAGALTELARRGATGDGSGAWSVAGHPEVLAELRSGLGRSPGDVSRHWRFEPRPDWSCERLEIRRPE